MATYQLIYKIPSGNLGTSYYPGVVSTNYSITAPTWSSTNTDAANHRMLSSAQVPIVSPGDTLEIYINKADYERRTGGTITTLNGVQPANPSTVTYLSGSTSGNRIETRAGSLPNSTTTYHNSIWSSYGTTHWLTHVVPSNASGYYSALFWNSNNQGRGVAVFYVQPSYGLQVLNTSGNVIFDSSDRSIRYRNFGFGTLNSGVSSTSVPVSGLQNNDSWDVFATPYGSNVELTVTVTTNSFTVSRDTSTSALDFNFWVVRV